MSGIISFHLILRQVDINNTFFNENLNEEVYMSQPPCSEVPNIYGGIVVCKLTRALYRLKQAPKAWFEKLRDCLLNDLEFPRSKYDKCLFIKTQKKS